MIIMMMVMMMIEAVVTPITIHKSFDVDEVVVGGRGIGSPSRIRFSSGSTNRVKCVDVGVIDVGEMDVGEIDVDENEEDDDDVDDVDEEDDVVDEEVEEEDDDVVDEEVEEDVDDDDDEDEDEDAAKREAAIDAASEISLEAIEATLFCLEDDDERMRGGVDVDGDAEIDSGGALDGSGRAAEEDDDDGVETDTGMLDDDDGVETDARTLDGAATDGGSEGGALTEGRG